MLSAREIDQLALIHEGMALYELKNVFSEAFIKKLQEHRVVFIDPVEGRVYLTAKGNEIRKIGFDKYLELEKIEDEYFSVDAAKLRFRNKIFLCLMFLLICVMGFFLIPG